MNSPVRVSLDQLNSLDAAGFAQSLAGVFEHAPWIAERAHGVEAVAVGAGGIAEGVVQLPLRNAALEGGALEGHDIAGGGWGAAS